MRRTGDLIFKIAEPENLQWAFFKASRQKQMNQEVVRFRKDLFGNLKKLRNDIQRGDVNVGNYRQFEIYEPKKRQIVAASFSERVLHHALMNVCHPLFERHLIFDTYATRPGKGTYAALDRARHYTQKYSWYLKLDYRKYFDTIRHSTLKDKLERLFKDEKLLEIFSQIIDAYSVCEGTGLPIGNLSSQYFANYYLSATDHYIKEVLGIPGYVRYMDDMILWHHDSSVLKKAYQFLLEYSSCEMGLKLKPMCMNRCSQGLPFLGYIIHPGRVRMGKRSKKRYRRKLKLYIQYYKEGIWNQEELLAHLNPLIGFTRYAKAIEFRKKVIQDSVAQV